MKFLQQNQTPTRKKDALSLINRPLRYGPTHLDQEQKPQIPESSTHPAENSGS